VCSIVFIISVSLHNSHRGIVGLYMMAMTMRTCCAAISTYL